MIQIDLPMPDGCDECPFNYDYCWCRGVEAGNNRDNEWPSDFDFTKRPGWCPLKDQPEIVRCKDCKWWHESKTHKGYGDCGQANGITLKSFDWFCADGQRKDSD